MFLPILLWTDALVFLLIAVAAAFSFHASRHEHLRAPWRRVLRSPAAMSSAVVLSGFLVIGILDSLHFRLGLAERAEAQAASRLKGGGMPAAAWAPEVKSVLDLLLDRLATRKERT